MREQLPRLAAAYGVRRIGLFGSFARAGGGAGSDVDLIVEFERPIGFRFVELVDKLEAILGRPVDALTPAGVESIRVERIAQDIAASVVYV